MSAIELHILVNLNSVERTIFKIVNLMHCVNTYAKLLIYSLPSDLKYMEVVIHNDILLLHKCLLWSCYELPLGCANV